MFKDKLKSAIGDVELQVYLLHKKTQLFAGRDGLTVRSINYCNVKYTDISSEKKLREETFAKFLREYGYS